MVVRVGIISWLLAAVALVLLVGCAGNPQAARPSGAASSVTASGEARFPDPVPRPLAAAQVAALQAVLNQVVADEANIAGSGAPGITAAVLTDGGSWAGAAGMDGARSPLRVDATMAIASISKTFAAAEVLHLAGAGKVDLDAPLSRYVNHPLAGSGATVRQTLSMQSGVTDPPETVADAMIHAQLAAPERHWTARDTLAYLKPRSGTPGGTPVYSNSAFLLLSLLIERTTGRPVAEAFRADLFAPAGLTRVAAQDAERPTPPVAAPPRRLHLTTSDGYLPCRAVASSGADTMAGIAADAPTLARWGYQLYGARLLPPQTVRAMITQQNAGNVFPGMGYGLGTQLFSGLTTDATVGHIGESPGYTSMLAVVPARHLSAAILIPEENRNVPAIMRNLLAAIG